MGYGKSSFVSNLICAESSSTWYDLRKQILAYHFCRYDMVMTINADTFVRNLASAIVNKYPEEQRLSRSDPAMPSHEQSEYIRAYS
jgi:hypothetical protein